MGWDDMASRACSGGEGLEVEVFGGPQERMIEDEDFAAEKKLLGEGCTYED